MNIKVNYLGVITVIVWFSLTMFCDSCGHKQDQEKIAQLEKDKAKLEEQNAKLEKANKETAQEEPNFDGV